MSFLKTPVKPFYAVLGIAAAVALGYGAFWLSGAGPADEPGPGGRPRVEPPYLFETPPPRGSQVMLPKDAIPAVFEPEFVGAADANMPAHAAVIGVSLGGESRAYSVNLMDRHEIVNDTVGGRDVAVTW